MVPESDIRILIVSEEGQYPATQRVGLEELGFEVDAARGCEEAIVAMGRVGYDAFIVRLRMGPPNGQETCERLVAERPGAVVIVCDEAHDHEASAAVLKGGAEDYVAESVGHRELGARIQLRVARARGIAKGRHAVGGTANWGTPGRCR